MLKKILTNTSAQLVAKAITVILSLVTTVLVFRIGGPGLFGDLTKVLAMTTICFTAIDFGLNAAVVREMRGRENSKRALLYDIILARIVLSLFAILIINLVVYLLPGGYRQIRGVYWASSIAILFQGLFTSANVWFQRRLEYWKSALATVIGSLVATTLTYIVLILSPTLLGLVIASTAGYLCLGIAAITLVGVSLGQVKSSLARAAVLLRASLPLGIVLGLSILASKLDTIILGILTSSAEVGEYGFAYRIFDVALTLPIFAVNTLYPLMIDLSKEAKAKLLKTSSLTLFILGCFGAIFLYILAPAIYLIRPGMALAVSSLRLLSLSLPIFYVTAPLMWSLIEKKQEHSLIVVYFLAALFNGVFNLATIPLFGAPAAAIATVLTESLIFLGLLYYSHKYNPKTQ